MPVSEHSQTHPCQHHRREEMRCNLLQDKLSPSTATTRIKKHHPREALEGVLTQKVPPTEAFPLSQSLSESTPSVAHLSALSFVSSAQDDICESDEDDIANHPDDNSAGSTTEDFRILAESAEDVIEHRFLFARQLNDREAETGTRTMNRNYRTSMH